MKLKKMKTIHYSSELISCLEDKKYEEEKDWKAKPTGLWVSVEGKDDWKEWCKSEKFCLERLRYSYEVILKENANILRLNTPEDIYSFTKKYPLRTRSYDSDSDTYQLNWGKIKNEYQGIIIAPYQWDCRLALESSWYYGWDCASGCIWDLDCIEDFIFIGEDLEMPIEPEKRESWQDIIKKSFKDCCDFIVEDGHTKAEYQFCEHTIMNTLTYLKGKRKDGGQNK